MKLGGAPALVAVVALTASPLAIGWSYGSAGSLARCVGRPARRACKYGRGTHPGMIATVADSTDGASASYTRLLLASNRAPPATFWSFFEPDSSSLSMAYVPTASMFLDPDSDSTRSEGQRRRRARESMRKQMKRTVEGLTRAREGAEGCDIDATFLDFADTNLDAAEARAVLESSDCVYLEGGNTFYLMHHMRRLGCDEVLREILATTASGEGTLLVGISAGAICAGRSISTALWKGT